MHQSKCTYINAPSNAITTKTSRRTHSSYTDAVHSVFRRVTLGTTIFWAFGGKKGHMFNHVYWLVLSSHLKKCKRISERVETKHLRNHHLVHSLQGPPSKPHPSPTWLATTLTVARHVGVTVMWSILWTSAWRVWTPGRFATHR